MPRLPRPAAALILLAALGPPALAAPVPGPLAVPADPLQAPTGTGDLRLRAPVPVTLAEAEAAALNSNRQLQAARKRLESAQASVSRIRAAYWPNLGLGASLTNSVSASNASLAALQARPSDPATGQAAADPTAAGRSGLTAPSTNLAPSLSLNYVVDTTGQRAAQLRQAESLLKVAELEVDRTRRSVRISVATGYTDLQEASERVRIGKALLDYAEANERDAEGLKQAGIATVFDVQRSRVQTGNARQTLNQYLAQQKIAARSLVRLLGTPPGIDVQAGEPLKAAGRWELDREATLLAALRNHPEPLQALAQREAALAESRAALAAYGLQTQLFANADALSILQAGGGLPAATVGQLPGLGYTAGARLQWGFFDAGAARALSDQALASAEAAALSHAEARNAVQLQTEQAFIGLETAAANIEVATGVLQTARESLSSARIRFRSGVGTQTDVIAAQNELRQAESNLITAIADYNRAFVTLRVLTATT